MTAFTDAIEIDSSTDAAAWAVPEGWQQGRGAWGGLVVGAMVHAATEAESDPQRRVRTVSAHLFGPTLAGDARIEVRASRIGSGMSTWAVDVVDASGEATANAVVITGAERAPALSQAYPEWGLARCPQVPVWQAVPVAPVRPPIGPVFSAHVEYRVVEGLPFTQGPARTLGWVRFADQGEWSAEQLLGIVDAWWPCAMPALQGPHPMATVSFSAHLLVDPVSIPAGEPLIAEAQMSAARDGFTSETRRLWTADGRLAVENHQSIVVIR